MIFSSIFLLLKPLQLPWHRACHLVLDPWLWHLALLHEQDTQHMLAPAKPWTEWWEEQSRAPWSPPAERGCRGHSTAPGVWADQSQAEFLCRRPSQSDAGSHPQPPVIHWCNATDTSQCSRKLPIQMSASLSPPRSAGQWNSQCTKLRSKFTGFPSPLPVLQHRSVADLYIKEQMISQGIFHSVY